MRQNTLPVFYTECSRNHSIPDDAEEPAESGSVSGSMIMNRMRALAQPSPSAAMFGVEENFEKRCRPSSVQNDSIQC